jgi:hypothetical protein
MSEQKARGYILAATAGFLQKSAGADKADKVIKGLSPELQEALQKMQVANWYPVSLCAELNRALVTHLSGNDETKARDMLIECGRHMGREASNTFLRLLMRMLTPNLLVKKFPDLWRRDFTGGRIEVGATDRSLEAKIWDWPGHDHIGPISAGWIGFTLEAMGKSVEKTIVRKWSLAEPAQEGVAFEFLWKN